MRRDQDLRQYIMTHQVSPLLGIVAATGLAAGVAQSALHVDCPTDCNSYDICLCDAMADPSVSFWAHGELNFDESQLIFEPFNDGVMYPKPYGDWLGYDASGLFDVDGDGYNDWAATWYFAEPVSGILNITPEHQIADRLQDDDVVISGDTDFDTPLEVREHRDLGTLDPHELVGFVRIFSGKDHSQIGGEIWGDKNAAKFAHEIAAVPDVDGDGCADLLVSSNSINGSHGAIYVYAYSNKYNTNATDTDKRWVNILRIDGDNYHSELAYELEDVLVDVNNDGQIDIMCASGFWGTVGNPRTNERGAGWVYLMPKADLFQEIQGCAQWPADAARPEVKAPAVMHEDDYSIRVTRDYVDETQGSVHDIATAGDIDGDGLVDFAVTAPYEYATGLWEPALYFFLSYNGYDNSSTTLNGAKAHFFKKNVGWGGGGCLAKIGEGPANFVQIDLEPDDADFVIHSNATKQLGNNLRSITGVELDDDPLDPSNTDIALYLYDTGSVNSGGLVHVLLNMPARFQHIKTSIDSAVAGGTNPLAYEWDNLPLSNAEYVLEINNPLMNHASGLGLAGNFDGEGEMDCELAIGTTELIRNPADPNNDTQNIGAVEIWDFEPLANGNPPTRLLSVLGEPKGWHDPDPVIPAWQSDPNEAISIPGFRNGLGCEPGWDMDGDGRDDLVLRAGRFPVPVDRVPDPSEPSGYKTIGAQYGPYQVASGVVFVAHSPMASPAQPVVTAEYVDVSGYEQARITFRGQGLVPNEIPWDKFEPDEVWYNYTVASADSVSSYLDTKGTSTHDDDEMVILAVFNDDWMADDNNYIMRLDTRGPYVDSLMVGTDYTVICIADIDESGVVDAEDNVLFFTYHAVGDMRADMNLDGTLDTTDILMFLAAYGQGCS